MFQEVAPALPAGMEIDGPMPAGAERVLTPGALALVVELVRMYRPRVEELLECRREVQHRLDGGERPAFLSATAGVRESPWEVTPMPPDLADRRVELAGPADRGTIAAGLGSGASAFMADLEDTLSPTWRNVLEGQLALKDAVEGNAERPPGDGTRSSRGRTALSVRPRGWHLVERHARVDGRPATAALWDFGLYFWNNALAHQARGSGPYFHLPKIESHLEARLWNDVFLHAQSMAGLPRGTVRATCIIETLPAAFEMEEILWELREHSAGLAFGAPGLAFSFVKRLRADPRMAFPGRGADDGFPRACAGLLVQVCHRRGAPALGGVSSRIPSPDAGGEAALQEVRAAMVREVDGGFDGTRVAHPGLVPLARKVFDSRAKNRIDRRADGAPHAPPSAQDLLRPAKGAPTEAGLRQDIRVSVQVLEAWLRGEGLVPLHGVLEDVGTAELCRALAWHWIRRGAALDDGRALTVERFRTALSEELDRIRLEVGERRYAEGRFAEARGLFERAATGSSFEEFVTVPAYAMLESPESEVPRPAVAPPPGPLQSSAGEGEWKSPGPYHPDPRRWNGVLRRYGRAEVERLRGSVRIEHTLARMGAERLWTLLHERPFVPALGALTGNQAVQMVRAGLEAIYLSGWQVAADANTALQTYPDQSLYPADSVPEVVRRINRALQRADQIEHAEGRRGVHWFAPIVADAEAGFGGSLNAFELMKAMIEAGAAGVHFEDQVAAEKKCGHLGGKVLVPTSTFVRTLTAARLAADVMGVPTLLVARTDAEAATLIMNDVDPEDAPFIVRGERTPEGFYRFQGGLEAAIARGVAYAPYADVVWCETQTPDLAFARRFAEAIHTKVPGKLLAYNCSPSFNWRKHLDEAALGRFQRELGAMGYRFQFVTLAGFHALNHSMFQLARGYRERGMAAYSDLQEAEIGAEAAGYTATRHQREVGVGYFDLVATTVSGGTASTLALEGSTEKAQFHPAPPAPASEVVREVQRAIDEDHERLGDLTRRLERSSDPASMAAALEDLSQTLREHFAHEEHAKGLYGLLGTREPALRAELERLVEEHQDILRIVAGLVERTKGPPVPSSDLASLASALAALISEHESRELKLVASLA